jgi:NADPH:quinone reductase-like Zn-dependent oxidoreductase
MTDRSPHKQPEAKVSIMATTSTATMKAWCFTEYGGPVVLRLVEVPKPVVTNPRDLLVKVFSVATNPVLDHHNTVALFRNSPTRSPGVDHTG